MLIKTILNKCHNLKSFVYQSVELVMYRGSEVLDISVPSWIMGCQKPAPG